MPTMTTEQRIAESNDLLSYAQRTFVEVRAKGLCEPVERCKHCIASTFFSHIEGGLCEQCRARQFQREGANNTVKVREDEAAALHDVLTSYGGAGRQDYDALVMFSGGKDSTYLLHKLRTDYPKLRIVAVTVDSGSASAVALQNARAVARQMDAVDFLIVRPHRDLFYRAFRYALTHPKPGSCYFTIDLLDGELTFDIGRNLAARLHIPLFIAGTSTAQLRLLHSLDWFERPREIMLAKRTHTTAGYTITELSDPSSQRYWWDGTRWPLEQVPRNILPFHAWHYDEAFVQREVVRLGYLPPGHDNPLVTNSLLIPLMVCIDYARLGYCGFEPEFALLVREGRASRELWRNIFDAAAYLASTGELLRHSVDDILEQLHLRRQDVGLQVAGTPG
jgi:hypothetical protein